jgi:hypothetical protein
MIILTYELHPLPFLIDIKYLSSIVFGRNRMQNEAELGFNETTLSKRRIPAMIFP